MPRVEVPVAQLEFEEGGNTIWVIGPQGGTVLRIKVEGKITSRQCNTSPVSHLDLHARDKDPVFCLGQDVPEEST